MKMFSRKPFTFPHNILLVSKTGFIITVHTIMIPKQLHQVVYDLQSAFLI